jgi:hypothetical protein
VVSWLDTSSTPNQWKDLTTTTANGKVTAQTTHFTLFVVRFAVPAGVTDAGALTCDFAACTGGNIVGSWQIQGACFDFPNPFEGTCATSTFNFDTQFTGSIDFAQDGTYTSAITTGGSVSFTFPVECLNQLFQGDAGGQVVSCQDIFGSSLSDDAGAATCTGDNTTGCDCTKPVQTKTERGGGTYSVSGSTLTVTNNADGGAETNVNDFCISGGGHKLQVQDIETKDGSAQTVTWTAVR